VFCVSEDCAHYSFIDSDAFVNTEFKTTEQNCNQPEFAKLVSTIQAKQEKKKSASPSSAGTADHIKDLTRFHRRLAILFTLCVDPCHNATQNEERRKAFDSTSVKCK
jgi:hypothetical protein